MIKNKREATIGYLQEQSLIGNLCDADMRFTRESVFRAANAYTLKDLLGKAKQINTYMQVIQSPSHCKKAHAMTLENSMLDGSNVGCRKCRNDRVAARKAKEEALEAKRKAKMSIEGAYRTPCSACGQIRITKNPPQRKFRSSCGIKRGIATKRRQRES